MALNNNQGSSYISTNEHIYNWQKPLLFAVLSRKIDFFGRNQIFFELILGHVYCVHYNIASFYDIVSIDINSADLSSNPSRPNCL